MTKMTLAVLLLTVLAGCATTKRAPITPSRSHYLMSVCATHAASREAHPHARWLACHGGFR